MSVVTYIRDMFWTLCPSSEGQTFLDVSASSDGKGRERERTLADLVETNSS
jgi:hypothetical protein